MKHSTVLNGVRKISNELRRLATIELQSSQFSIATTLSNHYAEWNAASKA